jgi:hypothetical protein
MDITTLVQFGILGVGAIGVIFLLVSKAGIFKSDAYKQKIMEEARVGWGKENLERVTKDELKQKMQFARKSKQRFFIGMFRRVGRVKKSFDISDGQICQIWRSPIESLAFLDFLGLKKDYFYVHDDDLISKKSDPKALWIQEGEPISFGGIFTLMNPDADEMKKRKLLLENFSFKSVYEDLLGRTENFARSAIYLNLSHAETADLVAKRAEAWGGMGQFGKPKSFLSSD